MGTANNSTIKIQDVIDSGGIRTINISDVTKNQLLKDVDITTGRKSSTGFIMSGPLFHNVTLKNEYGDNHLTKFQDLDIAETYPITLHVTTPTTAYTGYTLYGFTADVTYPNGTVKSHSINITETTSDKNIEIENCVDNARVKIIQSLFKDSGATISSGTFDRTASVKINSIFTEGDGVICTGHLGYPCFTLSVDLGPVIPDTGFTPNPDTGVTTNREVRIELNSGNLGFYRVLIDSAVFATGSTLAETTGTTARQAIIGEFSNQEFTNMGINDVFAIATISIPSNAYATVEISQPRGSASSIGALQQYNWVSGTTRSITPGTRTLTLNYTILGAIKG